MYQVDEKDSVEELQDIPQSSTGAPIPLVIADEHRVILAYCVEDRSPEWDGTQIRVLDPVGSDEPIAIVRFQRCKVHLFGPPTDEAFAGHPLASRGLQPYGAFRVKGSSWIRQLERMNSVHRYHPRRGFGNCSTSCLPFTTLYSNASVRPSTLARGKDRFTQ